VYNPEQPTQQPDAQSERVIDNIADVFWTPQEEGGGFEGLLETWNQGGAAAVGSFVGNIVRYKVDQIEGGATEDGEVGEIKRDELMFIGSEVINEAFEVIATQVQAGAEVSTPLPESDEDMENAQGEALIVAIESYNGTPDPKIDAQPAQDFALKFLEEQSGGMM